MSRICNIQLCSGTVLRRSDWASPPHSVSNAVWPLLITPTVKYCTKMTLIPRPCMAAEQRRPEFEHGSLYLQHQQQQTYWLMLYLLHDVFNACVDSFSWSVTFRLYLCVLKVKLGKNDVLIIDASVLLSMELSISFLCYCVLLFLYISETNITFVWQL